MGPFSLHYSDENKKNTFDNGGNKGHELKTFSVNRPLCQKTQREILFRNGSEII